MPCVIHGFSSFCLCLRCQAEAVRKAQHIRLNTELCILCGDLIKHTACQKHHQIRVDNVAQFVVALLESDCILFGIQILIKNDISISSGNLIIRNTDINRDKCTDVADVNLLISMILKSF